MKIEYTPTYSTLFKCPKDFAVYLSKELKHEIDKDVLILFSNAITNKFAGTKNYLFTATQTQEQDIFTIVFYSGFLKRILSDIYSNKTSIDSKDINIVSSIEKYCFSNISISFILKAHQVTIINACLINRQGIVKAPTGSGKTFCLAELVRIFNTEKLKVLITVPTISLLYQMKQDIHDYFTLNKIEKIEIGTIGDGFYDFKNISVGIPNSLSKIPKTLDYLNSIEVLLVDECHTVCNPTFASIIEHCTNRKISLGFSATPEVNDGTNIFLEAFFGTNICNISENQMITQNIILDPRFCFYTAPKAFLPSKLASNALNIQNLTNVHRYKIMPQIYNYLIINNIGRNNIIVSKTKEEVNKNQGPVIILVAKVKGEYNHAELLQKLLKDQGLDFPIISGYISKKKKEAILLDLKENKIQGAIAGPKVLTAGISISSLSCLILAGAGKSDNDFIQRVGRLLRKNDMNDSPLVIDFIDQQYWFKTQSHSRLKTAKNIYGSHNIEII